jgi:two-component system sensor histidine kinase VicK
LYFNKATGKGISPDFMPKIFTPFATKSNKSTGLGLYISNKIVEAQDGRIWTENNNKKGLDGEKGYTFVYELPLIN